MATVKKEETRGPIRTPSVTTATTRLKAPTTSMRVRVAPPLKSSGVRQSDRYVNILGYGKAGVGKTTLFSTAVDIPEMRDVLFLSLERGELSLVDNPIIENLDQFDDAIVQIANLTEAKQVFNFIDAHCKYVDIYDRLTFRMEKEEDKEKLEKLEEERNTAEERILKTLELAGFPSHKRFRTVIFDSLSELETMIMDNLLGEDTSLSLSSISLDVETATFGEYKKNRRMGNTLVRDFRNLPCHFLAICSEAFTKDESGRQIFTLKLTGKLVSDIQAHFDIVGRLESVATKEKGLIHRFHVQPGPTFDAKNRRSVFSQPYFDNPTMATIMKELKLLGK